MTDVQHMRIQGIYQQKQPDSFMLRVKVPAGVLSVEQALQVCETADRFAGGVVHLTTRTSIELHWLKRHDLAEATRMLEQAGLTSRGSCGGAVRGVVCSTPFAARFPELQALAVAFHNHFTRNPSFEGLPKKFKIGVDADYEEGRHLIQDIGLVFAGVAEGRNCYDVWAAGGLGREPAPGFLLERGVPEERLIPLIEAVIAVYRQHTPPGKRLKHLVKEIGHGSFRDLVCQHLPDPGLADTNLQPKKGLAAPPSVVAPSRLQASVFAGELPSATLRRLSDVAAAYGGGFLVLTCDQNVAFHLPAAADEERVAAALAAEGFRGDSRQERVVFRICPGNHECRLGLVATRDVAWDILGVMGDAGEDLSWAIAGCPNSCSQPQLASIGIVTVKLAKEADGSLTPLFDLYVRSGTESFGLPRRRGISTIELLQAVRELSEPDNMAH